MADLKSKPLLKFGAGGAPILDPGGLDLINGADGKICPIVFLGDGRAGKSYLSSFLLGQEGVFVSSDSSASVTEGIDVALGPPNESGEQLLVLDCEGGNNALAEIHSLVNIIAVVACTHVVFVANNMASEAALHCLAGAIASRSVLRSAEGSGFQLPHQLTFVVNKTTLRYGTDALEKLLDASLGGEGAAGRDEVRQDIKHAFPDRQFIAVQHSVLPGYAESIATFKQDVYAARQPFMVSGVPVRGPQFCKILQVIIQEVGQMSQLSAPSMTRAVVFDGFLRPLADRLLSEARSSLPRGDDYDPDIEQRNPQERALAGFDEATSHLAPGALLDEAREQLANELHGAWQEVRRRNDVLGEATVAVTTEEREVVEKEEHRHLGGGSLLSDLVVTDQTIRIESRAVVQKRRGGEPVRSDWQPSRQITRLRQHSLEEHLPRLPRMRGRLALLVRTRLGQLLGIDSYEPCFCVLRDLQLMWWTLPYRSEEPTQCVNLLAHICDVDVAGGTGMEASFVVALKECSDTSGDNLETLNFRMRAPVSWAQDLACCAGLARPVGPGNAAEAASNAQLRDQWVSSLRDHAALAQSTAPQLAFPPSIAPPRLRQVWEKDPEDQNLALAGH